MLSIKNVTFWFKYSVDDVNHMVITLYDSECWDANCCLTRRGLLALMLLAFTTRRMVTSADLSTRHRIRPSPKGLCLTVLMWCDLYWDEPISPSQRCRVHIIFVLLNINILRDYSLTWDRGGGAFLIRNFPDFSWPNSSRLRKWKKLVDFSSLNPSLTCIGRIRALWPTSSISTILICKWAISEREWCWNGAQSQISKPSPLHDTKGTLVSQLRSLSQVKQSKKAANKANKWVTVSSSTMIAVSGFWDRDRLLQLVPCAPLASLPTSTLQIKLFLTSFNPLTAKLSSLNFHSLEIVDRWREPQHQGSENY